MLSRKFIEQQRTRLQALRDQIRGGEQKTAMAVRTLQEERGGEAHEFEEDAQALAEKDVYQALHDVDQRRVNDIDRALQKIAEGTYGLSDKSGAKIPKARLEATPEAILTVEEEREAKG